jgi:hypothetical protein
MAPVEREGDPRQKVRYEKDAMRAHMVCKTEERPLNESRGLEGIQILYFISKCDEVGLGLCWGFHAC